MKRSTVLACLLAGASWHAWGGEADVLSAELRCDAARSCRIDVTVRHDDDGWAHYADKWDVLGPDGAVLGTRVLLHPHDTEQPFTRSLSGLKLPAGITEISIRAHDKLHGYGGRSIRVKVP